MPDGPAIYSNVSSSRPAWAGGGPLLIPSGAPRTLTEALLATAEEHPEKGIIFVDGDCRETFCSYSGLVDSARRILTGLRDAGLNAGDRVILQLDNSQDHFATFWAAVLGGITPVAVAVPPSYSEKNGVVSKLFNTWRLLESPAVLASRSLVRQIQGLPSLFTMPGLSVIEIDPLKACAPASGIHASRPEDLVFFQLTSGSTGVPKCIQETHGGIVAHIQSSTQFNDYSSEDVVLNWLPVDHVVPILTIHLKDVYLGCSELQVQAQAVLADPLRWLDLMARHRVTHSWAPNFAFNLVAEEVARHQERRWDLSGLKRLMNAGEQVTLPVVRAFLDAVARFGVRPRVMQPAFGMAEACTCMTYQNEFDFDTAVRWFSKESLGGRLEPAAAAAPGAIAFIDLGPPSPGVEIRIADAQNRVVPESVIGRFQIKGGVITPGYLSNPEANEEAFVGDGWFNSGDLGFIRDGRLTLTGREKEIIIVRGANYYCYEVEDVANQVEGVLPTFTAACAVEDPAAHSEELALFFVPAPEAQPRADSVARAVKARIAGRLGINPKFVITLERHEFPKTTSGKIQRTQLKKLFEAGAFTDRWSAEATGAPVSSRPLTPEESRLAEIWSDVLGARAYAPETSFFEFGDSLRAAQVLSRVERAFGVRLPLSALFESASTLSGMAAALESSRPAADDDPILPVPRGAPLPVSTSQERIWLMDQLHGAGGGLYNVAVGVWLRGELDVQALERALEHIVQRHEILRTLFQIEGGAVVQRPLDGFDLVLPILDLSGHHREGQHDAAWELAKQDAAEPFDLAAELPIRFALVPVESGLHLLSIVAHQIVIDLWSLRLFLHELAKGYAAFKAGSSPDLPRLAVQFADFAKWQRRHAPAKAAQQVEFWKRVLADAPPAPRMPFAAASDSAPTFEGALETVVLGAAPLLALKQIALGEQATLHNALLSVFALLLGGYSDQRDVVFGSPAGGRARLELEPLIGFFVNSIPLRLTLDPELSFPRFVAQVRAATVAAYENQDVPFDQLAKIAPRHSNARHPLISHWFQMNDPLRSCQSAGMLFHPARMYLPMTQFDLTLFATEEEGELLLELEYAISLFSRHDATRLLKDLEGLILAIASRPAIRIGDLLTQIENQSQLPPLDPRVELDDPSARHSPIVQVS